MLTSFRIIPRDDNTAKLVGKGVFNMKKSTTRKKLFHVIENYYMK